MVVVKFYRFADPAAFEAACRAAGMDPEALPARLEVDRIGTIDGVPGFHVNAAWNEIEPAEAFAAFEVAPAHPVRVFAGVGS